MAFMLPRFEMVYDIAQRWPCWLMHLGIVHCNRLQAFSMICRTKWLLWFALEWHVFHFNTAQCVVLRTLSPVRVSVSFWALLCVFEDCTRYWEYESVTIDSGLLLKVALTSSTSQSAIERTHRLWSAHVCYWAYESVLADPYQFLRAPVH